MMEFSISALLLLWMPGPTEWIIIGIVILLLFGGRKIPELMRGLGKGVKEFKSATDEEADNKDQHSSSETDQGNDGNKER